MTDLRERFHALDGLEVPDVMARARMIGPKPPEPDPPQSSRRIGALVLVAAIALVAIVLGSLVLRQPARTPGSTGPTEPSSPPHPIGVGLVGLPSEGTPPSTPARGELMLGIGWAHTAGDPGGFSLHLYTDGRVIWQRLGARSVPSTGLIEQRLTADGVELVLAEALSTGLFQGDLHLPGTFGSPSGEIVVRDGDRLVRVAWGETGPGIPPVTVPTPEQVDAIKALDLRLEDLGAWLPASAWEDQEPRPFVPSRYSFCYETEPGVGLDAVLASLPGPAEELLRPLERTHGIFEPPDRSGVGFESWCSIVTTDQARSLAGVLDGADAADLLRRDVFGLRYESGLRDALAPDVTLTIEPALPHEP